jgi:hypothetical protein
MRDSQKVNSITFRLRLPELPECLAINCKLVQLQSPLVLAQPLVHFGEEFRAPYLEPVALKGEQDCDLIGVGALFGEALLRPALSASEIEPPKVITGISLWGCGNAIWPPRGVANRHTATSLLPQALLRLLQPPHLPAMWRIKNASTPCA